jgi:hypothetical protein
MNKYDFWHEIALMVFFLLMSSILCGGCLGGCYIIKNDRINYLNE